MKTRDAKIATVLFYLLLLPFLFVWYLAIGGIIMVVLMGTGVIHGSAAASGTWVFMSAIVFATFAIGMVSIMRDLWRRMHTFDTSGKNR